MPVLSPHRGSTSLTGSYRSSLGSSPLDRSYYSSTNSYPRYSFTERYTTRSYTDSDGRRIYSRSGSITEDGVTTRFREETREGSLRRDSITRDSGIGSIRENSILETTKRERDNSVTRSDSGRENRYTQLSVIDSVADLRNKYSPANYIPAVYRNKENISRSKSINDIGLPPIERADQKNTTKKKVKDGVSYNNSLGLTEFSNSTNDNMYITEDDNGNRPPVSEIRKRFENNVPKTSWKERNRKEEIGDAKRPVKLSKIDKDDKLENDCDVSTKQKDDALNNKFDNGVSDISKNATAIVNGLESLNWSKSTVSDRQDKLNNGIEVRGSNELNSIDETASNTTESSESKVNGESRRSGTNRVNNFSSYIPIKDYEKGDVVNGIERLDNGELLNNDNRNDMNNLNKPRLSQDKTSNSRRAALKLANLKKLKLEYERSLRHFCLELSAVTKRIQQLEIKLETYKKILQIERFIPDLTASPRLNRTSLVQNASGSLANSSATTSNSIGGRSSLGREDDRNSYERAKIGSSPVRHQGLNGLKNIGNTCFMNSVIQCLSNTKPLLEYLRRDVYTSDINTSISSMKGALIKAFSQVIKELWSEDSADRVVNTVSLKSQIQRFASRFMGYAQQDAQEFLRYLLEGLHEDVNRVTTKPAPIHAEIDEKLSDADKSAESWQRYLRMDDSKIVDIFVGQLKSTLRCTYCGHCSVTFDPFWDLSLPIPQKVGPVRLQQCLESFTREETLDGDEKPTCSKCKERRKCTKSFSIQKFPKILVIHLKRFSPTERFRGKLSVTVDFPLEGLDMSNYSADNHTQCRYNLYAISNHSGTTYSGHYTAYCRHPYSLSWHEYNDSRVSSISSKNIISGEAYVLFYELDGQKAHL